MNFNEELLNKNEITALYAVNRDILSYSCSCDEDKIIEDFMREYAKNPEISMCWLFYARDIRNGMGQRKIFRIILNELVKKRIIPISNYDNLYKFIAKYGRLDDFINLIDEVDKNSQDYLVETIAMHLAEDILNLQTGRPVSLLAKWMPSINTSSEKTRARARIIAKALNISHASYRILLKDLRKAADVLESKISRNEWDKVDYNKVPFYANLKYSRAFMRHDPERRYKNCQSFWEGLKEDQEIEPIGLSEKLDEYKEVTSLISPI